MKKPADQKISPFPSESMVTHLANLKNARAFNAWMFSQLEPWIRWGKVWEIGSGTGNMSDFLSRADFLCLTEYDAQFRAELERKYRGKPNISVEEVDLTRLNIERFRSLAFDTIISTNVLEHIQDDVGAVGAITATMKSDTHLITLVPAHPFLYGAIDKHVGHFRRYTKKSLRACLETAGQEILSFKFFNRLSAVGWFAKYKLFRSHSINESDIAIVERLIPLLKLEKYLPLPFGQSLISVSRKK